MDNTTDTTDRDLRIKILSSLSDNELALALSYATSISRIGVDATEQWKTVADQMRDLKRAYDMGYSDGMNLRGKRFGYSQ